MAVDKVCDVPPTHMLAGARVVGKLAQNDHPGDIGQVSTARFLAILCDAIDPIIHARTMDRRVRSSQWSVPENDRVRLEMSAGDLMRLQALFGELDADKLRALPAASKPSYAFIDEIDRIVELVNAAVD